VFEGRLEASFFAQWRRGETYLQNTKTIERERKRQKQSRQLKRVQSGEEDESLGQFHHHFKQSFYTRRSKKRKNSVKMLVSFCALGICESKIDPWGPWGWFHNGELFHKNMFLTAMCLQFLFQIFWQKEICPTAGRQMLVKLTTLVNFIIILCGV